MKTGPQTRAELIAIRDGNKRNKDVRALLLEMVTRRGLTQMRP